MCRGLLGCVLIVLNIVVMIVSLVFATIGGILIWSAPLMRKIIDKLMEELSQELKEQSEETINAMVDEIMRLSTPIGWGFFSVGIILFVFAILAFVGVCCHFSIALIIYAILLGILILVHIIILIIYFTNKNLILGFIHRFLEDQVMLYVSLESGEPTSILVAATMTTIKCCGYNNGSDFLQPGAHFSHNDSVNEQHFTNIEYPLPCCKPTENKYTVGVDLNTTCPYKFTPENSYIKVGCRKFIDEDFVKLVDFVAYISIGPLLLEVLLLIAAVVIVVLRKKE